MNGIIHSMETMGLLDGPGVRVVVFLQGCALRCQYCHNPDTWEKNLRQKETTGAGERITPTELVARLCRYKSYFGDRGGVTFSGGEPLLQPDFLIECLRLCHKNGIHTCLDTAGCGAGRYEEILADTDLLLYDVKETDPVRYQALTGQNWAETRRFTQAVRKAGTPLWVRQVVVPGMTDSPAYMESLQAYIRENLPTCQKVDLLPYHKLGENKYRVMGIPYPLEAYPTMSPEETAKMENTYFGESFLHSLNNRNTED